MSDDTAFIQVSLVETLQRSELGLLVDYSNRHKLTISETVTVALRKLLADAAVDAAVASTVVAAGVGLAQPGGVQ